MPDRSLAEVRVVVFDVGETLVHETRHWGEWADWLGIPKFTFLATMGGVIARGESHRHAFDLLRPGFDYGAAIRQRVAEGRRYRLTPADFYPDALPCLNALRERGLKIGIAGNQPAVAAASLVDCDVDADFFLTSQDLGFEKPDPRFFQEIIRRSRASEAHRIAYVGDRLDNDVIPAMRAGMRGVFIRRGPWAFLQAASKQTRADLEIENLTELSASLGA